MSVNIVKQDGSLQRIAGGTLYADTPIGTISPFGGSDIPNGYLLCDGQAVSRTDYSELFAAIGTTFGAGDGSTTFNVPDLREATTKGAGLSGKSSSHYDNDGIALGDFIEDRIRKHTHIYSGNTGGISGDNWAGMGPVGFTVGDMDAFGAGRATVTNGMGPWRAEGTNKTIVEGYAVNIDLSHTHAYSGTTDYAGSDTNEVKAVGVNYIIKARSIGAPTDIVESVKDALQYNVLKLVDTINYTKTQNYCHRASSTGAGMTIPFDELESYSDGNYTARIHVMVARKTNSGDLYFKTFIDIPIAKGTDPDTGLTIKSYGFIPDWSQESKTLPSSTGVYNNGIEVFLQSGTYDGVERDVAGLYYNYSIFNDVKTIVVYMPTTVGFITNSEITTYIEKIQIFKLD